jgi:hypothetical protein
MEYSAALQGEFKGRLPRETQPVRLPFDARFQSATMHDCLVKELTIGMKIGQGSRFYGVTC